MYGWDVSRSAWHFKRSRSVTILKVSCCLLVTNRPDKCTELWQARSSPAWASCAVPGRDRRTPTSWTSSGSTRGSRWCSSSPPPFSSSAGRGASSGAWPSSRSPVEFIYLFRILTVHFIKNSESEWRQIQSGTQCQALIDGAIHIGFKTTYNIKSKYRMMLSIKTWKTSVEAVIRRNAKVQKRSLYINKWFSYSQL